MTACERFRADCAPVWRSLHEHPFIRELAAATLPPEKFRFYLEQNLMYLPEYAKAMAVGVAKAQDVATMRYFAEALANVVESEIPENRELLARVLTLGAEDRGGAETMAPANVAYTSFLVGTALQHGPLEIMAAIVPCTWSYGDIATGLGVADHPVYAEWVRYFGSPEYGEIIGEMRARFDEMVAGQDEVALRRLSYFFTTSTRLERGFWDMAHGLEQWPDLR
jgi:thiaminase/transcriptional activator TenA